MKRNRLVPSPHRLRAGDQVRIRSQVVTLEVKLDDIPGGWKVSRAIDNIRYWNEDSMELVRKGPIRVEASA